MTAVGPPGFIPRELLSAEKISRRISELGAHIRHDYAKSEELVLVGILKGGFIFLADLARALADLPVTIEFLGLQSYGDETMTSGIVQITSDLGRPIEDKDVLVVEDIVDTGLTLEYLLEHLRLRRPRSVKTVALLDKPERRIRPVQIDYVGFAIPNEFVVGYGLDWAHRYRNLPYVGILDPEEH